MKFYWHSLLILVFSIPGFAQEGSNFEQRMYDIYRQSYSEEVSDERWAGYLAGVGNRTYEIRPGDTLWGLSVVFFGDGLFWSKIWSYNAVLTNPHFLQVGQNIRFFAGSVEEAPGVTVEEPGAPEGTEEVVAQQEEEGEERPENLPAGFKEVKVEVAEEPPAPEGQTEDSSEQGDISDMNLQDLAGEGEDVITTPNKPAPKLKPIVKQSQLYPGAPAIPPPTKLIKPVLKRIPGTFRDSETYDASQYDEKGISFDLRPPVRVNPLYVAHSFLYGQSAEFYPRVGLVIESEDKTRLVGLNQKVYIRSKEKLEIGERLTVMGREYRFDRNGVIGDVIEYQGTMEVSEKIRKGLFRGTIIKSISGIKGNPWLSREEIPSFADDYVGRPNQTKLQIIGGGPDNVTRFYGQSDVIFLAGGTNRGLRVGDIMGIYKRRDIRYRNTTVKKSPVPIGHIKIFRAEPQLASAFVISSDDVILPGDETGPPTIVEAKTTQSEKDDLNSIETGLDFNTDPNSESFSEEDQKEFEIE